MFQQLSIVFALGLLTNQAVLSADLATTKERPAALSELTKSPSIVEHSEAAKVRGEGQWSQVDLSDYVKDLKTGKVKQKVPKDLFELKKPSRESGRNSTNQTAAGEKNNSSKQKGNQRKIKLNPELSTSTVANVQRRQSRTSDVMNSQMMKRSMNGADAMQKSMPSMRERGGNVTGVPVTPPASLKALSRPTGLSGAGLARPRFVRP